jgi:hypothetical protein
MIKKVQEASYRIQNRRLTIDEPLQKRETITRTSSRTITIGDTAGRWPGPILRQIWHRGGERGACSLLEADCEAAAREIIGSLPLVKAGMLELVQLIPLLPYRGFRPRS